MADESPRKRERLAVAVAVVAVLSAVLSLGTLTADASTGAGGVVAKDAKALSLNESGTLHLTSKQGFTLNEKGLASGTVKGQIYVHLKIVSSSRVTVELNLYPSGGSITVSGSASYHREHTLARFVGSISVRRGTGTYAHARGSGLRFSGTIQRSDDSITVHVSGHAVD